MMKLKRPLLRYFGGKWRLAPEIIPFFLPHSIYIEPFCGASSVLLRKDISDTEICNDIDPDIITLWKCIQDPILCNVLAERIENTEVTEEVFFNSRNFFSDPLEDSFQMLLRSNWGFGSTGFRRKSRAGFRGTGAGFTKSLSSWRTLPNSIRNISKRVSKVDFYNLNAFNIIENYDSRDALFYVDPPYTKDQRSAKSIYFEELTNDDHSKLSEILHSVKGQVIISGYHSNLYQSLYGDWDYCELPSRIDGGFYGIGEVLWMNR